MSRARTLEACHRSAVADLLAAQYMIVEPDGYWTGNTCTGIPAARAERDFLQRSEAHPYKARGIRLRLKRLA